MSEGVTIHCQACKKDIRPKDNWWAYHEVRGGKLFAFCEDCVQVNAQALVQLAALHQLPGWGPRPRGSQGGDRG